MVMASVEMARRMNTSAEMVEAMMLKARIDLARGAGIHPIWAKITPLIVYNLVIDSVRYLMY